MHTPTLLQTAFTAATLIGGAAALPTTRRGSVVEDFAAPSPPPSRRGSLAPESLPGSRRGSFVDVLPPVRRSSIAPDEPLMNGRRASVASNNDIINSRRRSIADDSVVRRDSLPTAADFINSRRRSVAGESAGRRDSMPVPGPSSGDIINARRRSIIDETVLRRDSLPVPGASVDDIISARRRSAVDESVTRRDSLQVPGEVAGPSDIINSRRRSLVEDSLLARRSSAPTTEDILKSRSRSVYDEGSSVGRRTSFASPSDIVAARRRSVIDGNLRRSVGASSNDIIASRRRSALEETPVESTEDHSSDEIDHKIENARRELLAADIFASRRRDVPSSTFNNNAGGTPMWRSSFGPTAGADVPQVLVEDDVAPEDSGPQGEDHTPPAGVAVPLFKRQASPLSTRGVVNWDAADHHMDKISTKFEQGKIAFQKRNGAGLLGADLLSEEEMERREEELAERALAHRERSRRSAVAEYNDTDTAESELPTIEEAFMSGASEFAVGNPALMLTPEPRGNSGAAALNAYNNDLLWAGNVKIGSNGQSFLIDFDSGSSDLWVPGTGCTSSACANHKKYDPTKSTTSKKIKAGGLSVTYGDGSSTSGDIYTDTVSVGGVSGVNVPVGVATSVGKILGNDPEDGMMGLAYQSISAMGQKPFVQTLAAEKKLAAAQFSFDLGKSGSELYLGGVNKQKMKGNMEWHPVVSESYWVVSGKANVNGKSASNQFNAVVDTGTTVVVAPPSEAANFWSQVPGSESTGNGYYTFPCNTVPTVSFNFGGSDWKMSTENLNLGQTHAGSNQCVGSVVGMDVGVDAWILGDSFLKDVYTSFSFDKNAVGFAQKADEDN